VTAATTTVVDRAGRRTLLTASAVLMGASAAGLAGLVECRGPRAETDATDVDAASLCDWLPLSLVAAFVSAFSLGFGPVGWLIAGEVRGRDCTRVARASHASGSTFSRRNRVTARARRPRRTGRRRSR